jgi:hypothetical protein
LELARDMVRKVFFKPGVMPEQYEKLALREGLPYDGISKSRFARRVDCDTGHWKRLLDGDQAVPGRIELAVLALTGCDFDTLFEARLIPEPRGGPRAKNPKPEDRETSLPL